MKKNPFRGSTRLGVFLWFWNLLMIGAMLLLYVQGSKAHGWLAVAFTLLWVFCELMRYGGTVIHDRELAEVKVESGE